MSFGIYQQTGGSMMKEAARQLTKDQGIWFLSLKMSYLNFQKLKEQVSVCKDPNCQTIILLLDDKNFVQMATLKYLVYVGEKALHTIFLSIISSKRY